MILVTGATGLLGNSVVRELLARHQKVRVLVRPGGSPLDGPDANNGRPELAGLEVEVVQGQLDDEEVVRRAVAGCQAVVHSAALIHIGYHRLAEARQANVEGTRTMARACQHHGCRLVYISTVDTLPAALSPESPLDETAYQQTAGRAKVACTYVISKQEAEQIVVEAEREGLDAVILHPGLMLGPFDWKPSSGAMLLAVNKTPVVVAPRGTASVCDARDVARAVVESIALGRKGEHYILAGENLSYPQLCSRIVEVIGKPKRVFRMGPVIPAAARIVDWWNRISGRPEQLFNGASVAMGWLHHAYTSEKAERELNYTRRALDETLRDAWMWLKHHHQIAD